MSDSRSNIFEGRTLEEAVNKGLSALRLTRAEAMITVMQEGSAGFLGFGSRPFRVRMAARPGGAMREPEETSQRRVRAGNGGRDRGGRGGRDRGGPRGGRDGGGRERGGDRPARAADRPAPADRPAVAGDRPARAAGERPVGRGERRGRTPREGAPRESAPREERRPEERPAVEPVAQSGESSERPRDEHRGRNERGGRRGRRDRGPREGRREGGPERTPMPMGGDEPVERPDDRQPGFGMRGFEDRRRPGDRREEGGLPPEELDERRSGDERRGEMAGPGDDQDGDAGRRRRRGRRGGRRRHRGEEGAAPLTDSAEPMEPMESGNDFAPEVERPMAELPGSPSPIDDEESVANDESDRGYAPRRREREERHDREERREPQGEAMSGEQLEALTRQVTQDLMRAMGFDATVTVTPEDAEKMNVTVQVSEGEDLLTGRKGETRQALQHLINRMVNRGEGSRYHVQLEINDFWAQREKELEGQARQMADDAVSSGNEQVTDYLNAQERRIIHVTLREDSRVRTYAIGDGMIKRLAVAPAQFAETTEPLE